MTSKDEPLRVMDLETVDETAPLPQTKDAAKSRSVFDRLTYGGPARGPRKTSEDQSDSGGKNVVGSGKAESRAGAKAAGKPVNSKAGQGKARPAAGTPASTVNNATSQQANPEGTTTPSSGTGSVFDRLTSGEKLYRNSSQPGKKAAAKKSETDPVGAPSSSKQRQPTESVQSIDSPGALPSSELNNGAAFSPEREESPIEDDEEEDPVVSVSLVEPPARVGSGRRKKSAQRQPLVKRRESWKIARIPLSLVERTSLARGALPVLPQPLAWTCLLFNGLLPGTGTMLSGVLGMCFGAPRFSVHVTAEHRFLALVINLLVGVFQAITVLFCLVGWCWSLGWGILLVKVAGYYVKWKKSSLNDPDEDRRMMMNVVPVSVIGDEERY